MRKAAGFMFIIVLLLTGSIPLAANNSHSQIDAASTAVSSTNPLYLPVVLRNYMSSGFSTPEAALAELDQYQGTPEITGTTYYVANNGSDSNNGTSPSTPWQTIAKVNAQALNPGDGVLFKRGDVWREMLVITSSGTTNAPITFAAYGSGKAPAILGSTAVSSWVHVEGNVWRGTTAVADPSRGALHDGSVKGTDGWPGGAYFVALDGSVQWGNQEKYLSSGYETLQTARDWGWQDGYIYVYAEANPALTWSAVEVSQRDSAIEIASNDPQDWIVIDNIQMLFTQSKGFFDGYPAMAAEGLTISHSHIGWVGIQGGAAADGLKVWHSNALFQNNVIHDTGRHGAGVLPFGGSVNEITNVTFENNTFFNGFHTTGIDIQVADANRMTHFTFLNNQFLGSPEYDLGGAAAFNSNHIWTDPNSGTLENFSFVNNIFTYCHGKCLAINAIQGTEIYHNTFYGVNPTLANTQGQLYYIGNISNSVVRNNIFFNDSDTSFNSSFYGVKVNDYQLSAIDMDYNLHFATDPNAPLVKVIEYSGAYQMAEWSNYIADTGWDAHSPVPQNPLFVVANNYHLQAGSPAKTAGIYLGTANKDRDGQDRANPPSLGVYE
ncbi:MAG: hypothetical protein H6652_09085 [Ardenticatenaceae bacterium]|nr:hypothetical protein [Ardenticatenaceae bacterium]